MKYTLHTGDCLDVLKTLPSESVQCCVTSPPYWNLRDYGNAAQIGLEETPELFIENLVQVFREVRRVLRPDGVLFVNIGDTYAGGGRGFGNGGKQDTNKGCEGMPRSVVPPGIKPKDLVGIPWMLAFALRADGYFLRSDIIWAKPNPMPESVTDRPTKAHEYIFLLSKSATYFYNADAIREPNTDPNRKSFHAGARKFSDEMVVNAGDRHRGFGKTGKPLEEYANAGRNARSVWNISTEPCADAHFAVMPTKLVKRCILAGTQEGDTVLDPFAGSGTVGLVALEYGRKFVGIELNPEYCAIAHKRMHAANSQELLFAGGTP